MDNYITLSIIVPIYNVSRYLNQCVVSLINQTLDEPYEIILVDDGSTDRCPEMCDEYAKKYKNVVALHKKNGGLSDARNFGIDRAKGKWIAFVDSDDFVEITMFEKLYRLVNYYHTKMAMADFNWVDENGNPAQYDTDDDFFNGCISEEKIYQKLMSIHAGHYIVAWNKLYHRSLWSQRRFPVGKIHEDQFIMHEIFFEAEKIACTNDKLYNYRKTSGSIMNSTFSIKRLDDIEGLQHRFWFYWEKGIYERLYSTEVRAFNKMKMGMEKLKINESNMYRVKELLAAQKKCYIKARKTKPYSLKDKFERCLSFWMTKLYWRIIASRGDVR